MKQITEDYVSFEIAKLLKEKGFDVPCRQAYFNGSLVDYTLYGFCDGELLNCPSQSLALKWLREENDIQIEISIVGTDTWESPTKWMYGFRCQTKDVIDRRNADFSSYEEAVEAAILYVLKNLI